MRIVESGPADAPALLLLHGLSARLEIWDRWAELLSKDFRVIRIDLPGHGCTPRPSPDNPTIDADLKVVRDVLKAKGITHFSVAGNSRGGWLAWLLAAEHPEMVDKLILIDSIGLDARPGRLDRSPL
ncbi:MAG TPA: alpha/beta fold hydrolase, partial [Thermoanaerobaculia bacterium]|nr:alpha/beta fold hydrolase [Thermoanaerobaculia bacterium]